MTLFDDADIERVENDLYGGYRVDLAGLAREIEKALASKFRGASNITDQYLAMYAVEAWLGFSLEEASAAVRHYVEVQAAS